MKAYIGMLTLSCCVLLVIGQGAQEAYPSSRGAGGGAALAALAGRGGLAGLSGGSGGLASMMGGGSSSMGGLGGLGGLMGGRGGFMGAALLGLDMNSIMEMQMCRQLSRSFGGGMMQHMCMMRVLN